MHRILLSKQSPGTGLGNWGVQNASGQAPDVVNISNSCGPVIAGECIEIDIPDVAAAHMAVLTLSDMLSRSVGGYERRLQEARAAVERARAQRDATLAQVAQVRKELADEDGKDAEDDLQKETNEDALPPISTSNPNPPVVPESEEPEDKAPATQPLPTADAAPPPPPPRSAAAAAEVCVEVPPPPQRPKAAPAGACGSAPCSHMVEAPPPPPRPCAVAVGGPCAAAAPLPPGRISSTQTVGGLCAAALPPGRISSAQTAPPAAGDQAFDSGPALKPWAASEPPSGNCLPPWTPKAPPALTPWLVSGNPATKPQTLPKPAPAPAAAKSAPDTATSSLKPWTVPDIVQPAPAPPATTQAPVKKSKNKITR